jgi:lysyl-tRNA synthetase class 2
MSAHQTPAPATTPSSPAQDDNQLIAERREKLKALREQQSQGRGPAL